MILLVFMFIWEVNSFQSKFVNVGTSIPNRYMSYEKFAKRRIKNYPNRCNSPQKEYISPCHMTSQTRESVSTNTINDSIKYDLKKSLNGLSSSRSGTRARKILERALLSNYDKNDNDTKSKKPLYQSAFIPNGSFERTISDTDLALMTNVRNAKYSITDLIDLSGDKDVDRAALAILCITIAGPLSALSAQQFLPGPDILRFVIVWLLSFSPLALVGVGLSLPAELQSTLVSIQRNVFPSYRLRMIHHEAGHFLIGHLLGMPVQSYTANAIKNAVEFYPLNDADVGIQKANLLGFDGSKESYTKQDDYYASDINADKDGSFFGKGGRGEQDMANQSVFREKKDYANNPFLKLPSKDEPKLAWPYRGFDHKTIDQLAVVSVAGVCSEILAFGNAVSQDLFLIFKKRSHLSLC